MIRVVDLAVQLDLWEQEWEAWPANERATRPGLFYFFAQRLRAEGLVEAEA